MGISSAPVAAATPALAPTLKATPKPTAPMLNGAAKATPRAAPPPPPVPPARAAASDKDMYKALYNFQGQEGEMNLTKGELVEVKTKDDNGGSIEALCYTSAVTDRPPIGWWLVVKSGQEGWAPSN